MAAPTIQIGGRTLPVDDRTRVGWMHRTDPAASGAEIGRRIAEDGYCFRRPGGPPPGRV